MCVLNKKGLYALSPPCEMTLTQLPGSSCLIVRGPRGVVCYRAWGRVGRIASLATASRGTLPRSFLSGSREGFRIPLLDTLLKRPAQVACPAAPGYGATMGGGQGSVGRSVRRDPTGKFPVGFQGHFPAIFDGTFSENIISFMPKWF